MLKSAIKIAIVFYTFFAGWIHAQSVYVPLNFWAYDFIDRLETKGLITGALNNTKPYTRAEMVQYLLQVQNKIQAVTVLNAVEQKQFDFLRFEFSEEFIAATGQDGSAYPSTIQKIKESKVFGKIVPGFLYRNNRNLFSIKSPDFVAYIDPILYQQWRYANSDSLTTTEKVFERTHGFTMWGRLGSHIAYSFDFRDTKEWGTKTYPNEFDISLPGLGFVNGYGTH